MLIKKFRIKNYKSFLDSSQVELGAGFNIILGKNNAGKTALLEALRLQFQSKPHRSVGVLPTSRSPISPNSSVEVSLSISGEELVDFHINGGYTRLMMPKPENMGNLTKERALDFLHKFWQQDEIVICLEFYASGMPMVIGTYVRGFYNTEKQESDNIQYLVYSENKELHDFSYGGSTTGNNAQNSFASVGVQIRKRIYAFKAERMNVSSCGFGGDSVLTTNASNLPEVLHVLQTRNPRRFKKLNEYLRRIFSAVYEVSIRPGPNNTQQEIVVWTTDPELEREDLVVELSESGTGIGQVLAILYVVLTSEYPRTIIIDEPNSFLHPTAVRHLIEILQEFEQHQYILSTHSPEVISVSNPTSILMVSLENSESIIRRIDINDIGDLRNALNEIGSKISDLLGPECVLWVEGPTEEKCFEAIIKKLYKGMSSDIAIRAVRATGDFENKKLPGTMIWDIYEKISSASVVLPAHIAFEFDREGRTEKQMLDLEKRSGGKISFLPRRIFENYLIHPEALSNLLLTMPTFSNESELEKRVNEWIMLNGEKFVSGSCVTPLSEEWLINVDGAMCLKELVSCLSQGKEEYKKTTHGEWLTHWLLDNQQSFVSELVDFVQTVIKLPRN